MTTERPYRPALPAEEALAMLSTDLGYRFDPALVALFERAVSA
jgi:HD-GYP domain-containing protein (c-di-GMP phosphodiesterase class II)